MDPLTQGTLGAALPVSCLRRKQDRSPIGVAAAAGCLAGLVPDLDVLIRSSTDSLLFLEYHRQFTHSLIFIPVGSFLVAGLLYLSLRRWRHASFIQLWLFAAAGYATHGLLDTATSYGTQLLWPFSDARFSLSIVSIVDPLFTGPLAVLLAIGIVKRNSNWARIGLVWVMCYLAFGAAQHQTARTMAETLARDRGHAVERLAIKPTFGNTIVWKSIYESDGRFYVDAIRPRFGPGVLAGGSMAKLDTARDFPWLQADSQQARDVERFARFSDDYLVRTTDDAGGGERIVDVRYSFLPHALTPLWSIGLNPHAGPDAHVSYDTHRDNVRGDLGRLLHLITVGFNG